MTKRFRRNSRSGQVKYSTLIIRHNKWKARKRQQSNLIRICRGPGSPKETERNEWRRTSRESPAPGQPGQWVVDQPRGSSTKPGRDREGSERGYSSGSRGEPARGGEGTLGQRAKRPLVSRSRPERV
ncbi:hypothetical protein HZ326_5258 [Fusarium oxysporum f. sp. albedinis]|nr:hypothetical protein HZ326_5258 [Fusarium oxysporum f. sp. albedinis]